MKQTRFNPDRRRLLWHMGMVVSAITVAAPWRQILAATDKRVLSFYHTHTGERLNLTYFDDGQYNTDTLEELNRFLRDFRSGEIFPIEKQLLDILYSLITTTGSKGTIEVISGYRSHKTNDALRKQGRGVAERSLHMQGRALDIRLTDVKTSDLRDAAVATKVGGVGYYPKSDFIHIDTGSFRTW